MCSLTILLLSREKEKIFKIMSLENLLNKLWNNQNKVTKNRLIYLSIVLISSTALDLQLNKAIKAKMRRYQTIRLLLLQSREKKQRRQKGRKRRNQLKLKLRMGLNTWTQGKTSYRYWRRRKQMLQNWPGK